MEHVIFTIFAVLYSYVCIQYASMPRALIIMIFSQLNFGQYKRVEKFSYQMMSPGKVQISGFCDTDNYTDVVTKGTNELNINANPKSLKLLVSGGLVSNYPLQDGKEWTLGQYTIEIGGVATDQK